MPDYRSPGVYVEEVSSGARPIQAVGTSTAGFIGLAPMAKARLNELVWINNWTEFQVHYAHEVEEETKSPSKAASTKATSGKGASEKEESSDSGKLESTDLSQAVFGYFLNGGSRCCVVNTGKGSIQTGLDLLERSDEVTLVAAPGKTDQDSYGKLLSHCEKMKNRVAILDAPATVDSISKLTESLRPRQSDGGYGAFYFPQIEIVDPITPVDSAGKPNRVVVPPSGHVAGICARTDAVRGVQKAPANEAIRGALDLTYKLTRAEQAELNPAGVNCIRYFPGEGIRIYGARTVAGPGSEWVYLNVRRLLNMIEESIARSTRWAVFEPNDRTLWKSLRRDVGAFLTTLWRQGALMGSSPEEAFFVKCDEETNPQEEIDLGRVYVLIGVAPVKPAEFVIFRIGQSAAGSEG